MYTFSIRFTLVLFMVSAVSDIVLNYFSKQNNANATLNSLRPYYNKYGDILSPILAGLTIIIVYLINLVLFQIIIKTLSKSTIKRLEQYVSEFLVYLFLFLGY